MTLEDMLTEAGITEMEIMEYADGVLAPARRPVVRAALAKYPELMQLLETFIFTRGPLKDVYDEVLKVAPPRGPARRSCCRPSRRLRRDDVEGLVPSSTHGLGLPPGRRLRSRRCARSYWLHGCCSVAPAGYDFATFGERGYVASSQLKRVLDTTPQGETARISRGLSIRPRSTFNTEQGTRCREMRTCFILYHQNIFGSIRRPGACFRSYRKTILTLAGKSSMHFSTINEFK